jgi:predicted enzyme related to lactoylglutathione lyase
MSLFKKVNVVSIDVTDWERAKKFYDDVLGWPVAWSDDGIGWREYGAEGEAHVSINKWEPHEGHPNRPPVDGGTTLILAVDNAAQVTADLRQKGIQCDDPVTIPGVVTYGTFYDPEGNRIQFVQSTPPAA